MSRDRQLVLRLVRGAARVWHGTRTLGSAIAVVRKDESEVLLVRDRHRRREWVLPGGFCHRGELPSQAAIRELREETNLDIRTLAAHPIVLYDSRFPHVHFLWAVQHALQYGEPRRTGSETIEVAWHRLTALPPTVHHRTTAQLQALSLYPRIETLLDRPVTQPPI